MNFRRIFSGTAALIGAAVLLTLVGCSNPLITKADQPDLTEGGSRAIVRNNSSAWSNGIGYTFWTESTNAEMNYNSNYKQYTTKATNHAGGMVAGVGWNPGSNNKVVHYTGSFTSNWGGMFGVYGWVKNSGNGQGSGNGRELVEYYICDMVGPQEGPHNSPDIDGATHQYVGKLTSDGSTYYIYTNERRNKDSIVGFTTFWQYVSVRVIDDANSQANPMRPTLNPRTSGTITVANHFNVWQNTPLRQGGTAKMKITGGTHDYMVLTTEYWPSSSNGKPTGTVTGTSEGTILDQAPKQWQALGSGVNDVVYSLATNGSTVYAGGFFTSPYKHIAKYNGSWSAVGTGNEFNWYIGSLAVNSSSGTVYAGGNFQTPTPYFSRFSNGSWSGYGMGADTEVLAVTYGSNKLYIGGYITNINGVAVKGIAMWNGTTWSAVGDLRFKTNQNQFTPTVSSIAIDSNGVVYAAWNCSEIAPGGSRPTTGFFISKWNGSSWTVIASWQGSYARALACSGTTLFAGGGFSTIGSISANNIAKYNGSSWSALGTGVDNEVYALVAESSSIVYAGGNFHTAGGVTVNHIAKCNGTTWSALGSGMNDTVYALARDSSGNLYAGGWFTSPAKYIAVFK